MGVLKHPIDELIAVMAKLRDPDGGCPWDLQQDFRTIAPYTIEEAYEVADAIARNDMTDLKEELGDLLLQPIYHAQMAKEAGHFDINDVIRGITAKMIERHPHVFGDKKAKSASDVNVIWDKQKSKEKSHESVLDAVPKAFPALLRAKKLQSKAAKVGFEWKKLDDVLDKLEEELGELREAVKSGDTKDKREEFGDLLFVLVNFARMNGIDAEDALRECNDKFERRFRGIEKQFSESNRDISKAPLEEMERMWVSEKNKEKKKA
ncbi:MAG: nucleoside triphosphate pyrophosphohydrolase [Alphaproteobacteria bacterium]